MSSWAKPGVKCVCVDDDWLIPLSSKAYRLPMLNEVLTVSGVFEANDELFLAFDEIPYDQGLPHRWHVIHFKPLITQSDDIAMFKSLLTPALVGSPELEPMGSD